MTQQQESSDRTDTDVGSDLCHSDVSSITFEPFHHANICVANGNESIPNEFMPPTVIGENYYHTSLLSLGNIDKYDEIISARVLTGHKQDPEDQWDDEATISASVVHEGSHCIKLLLSSAFVLLVAAVLLVVIYIMNTSNHQVKEDLTTSLISQPPSSLLIPPPTSLPSQSFLKEITVPMNVSLIGTVTSQLSKESTIIFEKVTADHIKSELLSIKSEPVSLLIELDVAANVFKQKLIGDNIFSSQLVDVDHIEDSRIYWGTRNLNEDSSLLIIYLKTVISFHSTGSLQNEADVLYNVLYEILESENAQNKYLESLQSKKADDNSFDGATRVIVKVGGHRNEFKPQSSSILAQGKATTHPSLTIEISPATAIPSAQPSTSNPRSDPSQVQPPGVASINNTLTESPSHQPTEATTSKPVILANSKLLGGKKGIIMGKRGAGKMKKKLRA